MTTRIAVAVKPEIAAGLCRSTSIQAVRRAGHVWPCGGSTVELLDAEEDGATGQIGQRTYRELMADSRLDVAVLHPSQE